MSLPLTFAAEMQRIFEDWGQQVTYEQVESTVDLETQQVSEIVTAVDLLAMVSHEQADPAAATGGQAVNRQRAVTLLNAGLPRAIPALTDRILIETQRYRITGYDHEVRTDLITLHLVKS